MHILICGGTGCKSSNSLQIIDNFHKILEEKGLKDDVQVIKTGCMGYCHAEPTLEVRVPGKDPIVFGHVDNNRADEILTKYVQNGELVEGIIPVNYETIDK